MRQSSPGRNSDTQKFSTMMVDTRISPSEIQEALAERSAVRQELDAKFWQVFFLPTEDVDDFESITAFCPFTGVIGVGSLPFL